MFQSNIWDFGWKEDVACHEMMGRRINFIFAVKQKNDGKINSHKFFYEGICKYL